MTSSARPNGDVIVRPVFDWLMTVAVLGMVGLYVRAIYFTPMEVKQGLAQKIYYVHVPAAIAAYLAVTIASVTSIIFLWLRDERSDRLAESSMEVALVFLSIVLVTGPIWAKVIWGTWWSGDARANLTLFLWFIVAAYMILRGAVEDSAMRARYSAVLAVLGTLLIPFIHLSVYLWRTMHPMPIVLQPGKPQLPSEMLVTFVFGVLAALVLCVAFIRARYRYGVLRDLVAARDARLAGGAR